MTTGMTVISFMDDQVLFPDQPFADDSWSTWKVALKAIFGLSMTRNERRTFRRIAGRRPPRQRVREAWALCGRRSGKTRIAAAITVFLATCGDHSHLARGERGHVLLLATDKSQAKVAFEYVVGLFQSSEMLRQRLDGEPTAEEVRLTNGITIGVHANNFRSVRGRTLIGAVLDETAFWRDESSAVPDIETYSALLPALATTGGGGLLIGISSTYRRAGLIFEKWRDYYGKTGDTLVLRGPTKLFNPSIDSDVIGRARAADPVAAASEWDAEFRSDLASFLGDAMIDGAIDHNRPLELPPRDDLSYVGFVDASGGRHDSYTIAVGHREDDKVVIDLVRGQKAPFDPASVTENYAMLSKLYGLASVEGDRYSGEWVVEAFRKHGIEYRSTKKSKSELYLESLPNFAQGRLRVPNHKALIRELRLLERRTHRSGRDSVDHGPAGADDHANSVAGVMWALRSRPEREIRIRDWSAPAEDPGQRLSVGRGLSPYTGSTSFDTWARGG